MSKRQRIFLLAFLWPAAALLVPLFEPSQYILHILIIAGIYVILVQSMHLVLGFVGLLSLGTPAFFGVGAYATTLLSVHYGMDTLASFALAGAIAFVAAAVIGIPSLRLSSHSFVIVTLSFALLLQLIAMHWVDLTRGALGFPDIPPPHVFGFSWNDKRTWLYAILLADLVTFLVFLRIVTSRLGRALVATRDNEILAEAVGFNTFRLKIFVFSVAGAYAGLGGAFFAHYITFIDPNVFGFSITENLLVMVILGGSGTLFGPLIGAVVFTAVPEFLRFSPEYRSLLYGVVLLAAMLAFPKGLGQIRRRARPPKTGTKTGKPS